MFGALIFCDNLRLRILKAFALSISIIMNLTTKYWGSDEETRRFKETAIG